MVLKKILAMIRKQNPQFHIKPDDTSCNRLHGLEHRYDATIYLHESIDPDIFLASMFKDNLYWIIETDNPVRPIVTIMPDYAAAAKAFSESPRGCLLENFDSWLQFALS